MIRLLVVDDSALMRRLMASIFGDAAAYELAFAQNAEAALAMLPTFRPDVITLDINMPGMDGLTCLDRIMVERPTPVVVVSSLSADGAETTLAALQLGAVDFLRKPDGAMTLKLDVFGPMLIDKVQTAAKARVRNARRLAERVRHRIGAASSATRPVASPAKRPPPLEPLGPAADATVLIGCSTGGPPALDAVLSALPADFPWPIIVAQHMPALFTAALARRLDTICALHVEEVLHAMPLRAGVVYVASGDADIVVAAHGRGAAVRPVPAAPELPWHPSVDRLVESAIERLGADRLIGVLMTGMGYDGATSMTRLREGNGRTIAEAQSTAVVWGMPGELVRAGGAEIVAPLDEIAPRLLALAGRA